MHALVSIQAAVADGVFATRSGDLVVILSFSGVAGEYFDPQELNLFAHRFEAAIRVFDEHFRVYQYLLKRKRSVMPAGFYENVTVREAVSNRIDHLTAKGQTYALDSYMAVVYEGWRPIPSIRQRWKQRTGAAALFSAESADGEAIEGMNRAAGLLRSKAETFVSQWKDIAPARLLDSQQGFRFLRRLLNYSPLKTDDVNLTCNSFVNYQACNSSLECHRDFLRLDEHYVRVLTLKEPPSRTFAQVFGPLLDLPCSYVIASEWKAETPTEVRRVLASKRRHFHNLKTSLSTHLSTSSAPAAQDRLINDGAVALVNNLGGCLEELEIHGRTFGQFSLTLALYDQNAATLATAVAQCYKIFAVQDAQLTEEDYNRLNAWAALVPGNRAYNLRRLWLTSANYADLSFLSSATTGEIRNEQLGTEYLAVLEGRGGVPYFFNLHYKDVGHTFVSGATGSGKSFLMNFLLTHLQKYSPFTFIFDLGGSYESITRLFGGSYLPIGATSGTFKINPFSLPLTPANRLFLASFARVLIESAGHDVSHEDEQDLFEQIENLYSVPPEQRRLGTLSNIVRRTLRGPLQKWVEGGPQGTWFDHAEDELTFSKFQTFNFDGMETTGALEPLLFCILHRANAKIDDASLSSVFKAFAMDEVWRLFRHPVIKAYVVEALKTWRKKNGAMILVTQSCEDLINSEMLSVVAESCPTKLFLANPGIDRRAYRDAFHLNETEVEGIAHLVPKKQILVKRPDGSSCVELSVDAKGYWLYTNNPRDNARKREAFAQYGFREGLEILSKEAV